MRRHPEIQITFPKGVEINVEYCVLSLDRVDQVLREKTVYEVIRATSLIIESREFTIIPLLSNGIKGLTIVTSPADAKYVVPPIFASLYGRELRTGDLNPSLLRAL